MLRLAFLALNAGAAVLLGLFVGSANWLGAIVIVGGAVTAAVVLYSPLAALLGWLAVGPTLGGLVDAVFGEGIPALTPDRVLLLLVVARVAAGWLARPRERLPLGRMEAAMAIFVVLAAVSALVRGGTRLTHQEGGIRLDFIFLIQGYAIPFVAFFLAKQLVAGARGVRALVSTLVGLSSVLAVVGILQYFTGTTLFFSDRFQHITEHRATGTIPGIVDYGMVLSSGALAAIFIALRSRALPARAFFLALTALIFTSVVLCKTRSVWLGIAVGLAIGAWREPRFRRPLAVAGLAAALLGAAVYPFLADSEFFRGRVTATTPILNRIAIWATAVNMIVDRPLLGGGFGRYMFREDKLEYLTGVGGVPSSYAVFPGVPHNEFLHVLTQLGLVGFLPYLLILTTAWRTSVREYARRAGEPGGPADACLVAAAMLGVFVVNGLLSDLMFSNHTSNQLYVLLGAVDGLRLRGGGTPSAPAA